MAALTEWGKITICCKTGQIKEAVSSRIVVKTEGFTTKGLLR